MKKYSRKQHLVSPIKVGISALVMAVVTVAVRWMPTYPDKLHIVSGGMCAVLLSLEFFLIIEDCFKYSYSKKCIKLSFMSLMYKKIDYSQIATVVISNASYNNGYGYGPDTNIPMQCKVKTGRERTKITLPFITIHQQSYPLDKIEQGMSSRDLFMLDDGDIVCLGVCWFDSLRELLKHVRCSIYVLEDVYLRFKKDFDVVFSEYEEWMECFYIISDHQISYHEYTKKCS